MGIRNMRAVYEIPSGFVHTDERLVLLVVAEQTNDKRQSWGHDRPHLRELLGGVSDSWLQKRLHHLEEAGFLERRQPRLKGQIFGRSEIDLTWLCHNGLCFCDDPKCSYVHARPTRRSKLRARSRRLGIVE